MAHQKDEPSPFTGFGIGNFTKSQADDGVFILAIYHDGNLTAAAYATERGAMEAAVDYLESERDDEDEGGSLEDLFRRAQQVITDDGGVMEIIAGPVHGG